MKLNIDEIAILKVILCNECTGDESKAPIPDFMGIISPPKNLNQLMLVNGR